MKPKLLQRIQEQIIVLEDLLGYQTLDRSMDYIEIQRVEETVELLKEIETLFN